MEYYDLGRSGTGNFPGYTEIDMTDPEYFKQPFPRVTYEYSASNLKLEPFKCSPAGLTGTIRK